MKSHPDGISESDSGVIKPIATWRAEKLTTCWSLVVADMILLQCLLSAMVRWPDSAGVPAIRETGAAVLPDSEAVAAIRETGFAVLPTAAVPRAVVDAARAAVGDRLSELLVAVDDAGCDVVEQQYSFSEICHRKRLRWDLRMPGSCGAWSALAAHVEAQALPRLAALARDGAQPRVLMSGAVVSRAGAGPQSFHADGDAPLVNVFVPLVDIAPETDGTQFWPGSHRDERRGDAAARVDADLSLASDADATAAMVSPGCAAGGLLCFDYRVVHRGLANRARERAVAYFVVALDAAAADRHNFPDVSVRDAPRDAVYPFWDDAVGRVWSVARDRRDGAFRQLASARRLDEAGVKALVRRYCEARGLDWASLQNQESAAKALKRDVAQEFT